MSITKRLLEIEEGKNDVALSILKKAGAITVCDACGDIVDNQDESALKEAYKIANSMITKSDELVADFKGDRKELTDLIKSAYADVNWECHCEEVMKE
jgi:hypothetical protein